MGILILGSLPNTVQARLVSLMITMTEVKPGNVHAGIDQLLKGGNIPACGPHGTDDFGFTSGDIGSFCDTFEGDVGAAEFGA